MLGHGDRFLLIIYCETKMVFCRFLRLEDIWQKEKVIFVEG